MRVFPTEHNKIYLCYCENDERLFLKNLLAHLKPLEKLCATEIWCHKSIQTGTNQSQEIDNAIQTTKVAILLVSAQFLASDLVLQKELPPLLQALIHKEINIIPVLLSDCYYGDSPLSEIQFANPRKPLEAMSKSEINKLWKDIVIHITKILNISSSTFSSYSSALEQKRKETTNKPAYLDLLQLLSNQTLPGAEHAAIALRLAEVALKANEAEKQSLRGRLRRLLLEENSELVQDYITLILGILDDYTESQNVQRSYLKLDKYLPPHLRKAIEEYLAQ